MTIDSKISRSRSGPALTLFTPLGGNARFSGGVSAASQAATTSLSNAARDSFSNDPVIRKLQHDQNTLQRFASRLEDYQDVKAKLAEGKLTIDAAEERLSVIERDLDSLIMRNPDLLTDKDKSAIKGDFEDERSQLKNLADQAGTGDTTVGSSSASNRAVAVADSRVQNAIADIESRIKLRQTELQVSQTNPNRLSADQASPFANALASAIGNPANLLRAFNAHSGLNSMMARRLLV